jgi:hypothetical protein
VYVEAQSFPSQEIELFNDRETSGDAVGNIEPNDFVYE